MYKHIMLPFDGSQPSVSAEKQCIAFAKSIGAKLTVIHVVSLFHLHAPAGLTPKTVVTTIEKEHKEEAEQMARKMIAEVEKHAKAAGVRCDGVVVVGDNPHDEIIGNARKSGCDLIMMASHGRRGLDALLLGSETVKVLTHSKIPVLVVR